MELYGSKIKIPMKGEGEMISLQEKQYRYVVPHDELPIIVSEFYKTRLIPALTSDSLILICCLKNCFKYT